MLTNYVCVGGCEEIISICVADPSLVLQKYPFDQNWMTGWWVIANGQNGCNHAYKLEKYCVEISGKVQSLNPDDKHSWFSHLFLMSLLTLPLYFQIIPDFESFNSRKKKRHIFITWQCGIGAIYSIVTNIQEAIS